MLHAEHRAWCRFHQRPAPSGPKFLVSRHADQAPRSTELHSHSRHSTEMSNGSLPTGWACRNGQPGRTSQLRAELVDRRPSADSARTPSAASGRSRRARRATSDARDRRASPITTAKQASSTAANPPSSRDASSTHSHSSSARSSESTSANGWSPTCATSTRTSPQPSRINSASRSCHQSHPLLRSRTAHFLLRFR